MDHQPLTFKAINRSPDSFYRHTYPVMKMSKDKMIDLELDYADKKIVMVDSCGWFYQQAFPNADIHKMESLHMCKNVSMSKEKIDSIFDDRNFEKLKFPSRKFPSSVLIVDHSPILKYRNAAQMHEVLTDLTQCTQPEMVHVRLPLFTTNDYRFSDRLHELVNIVPNNYITTEFLYNINSRMLITKFKKLQNYASSLY
jgi:hypothetical protein